MEGGEENDDDGGARWKGVAVVPFTVYLDDSGTSPSQHVAIASAVIIPASRLLLLEREWERLRRRSNSLVSIWLSLPR